MPYFGGASSLRYALRPDGSAYTIDEFFPYVESMKVDPSALVAQAEEISPEEPFPDFPPCLNQMFVQKIGSHRNVILANWCVAFKKAELEDWEKKVEEINRNFAEPLSNKEVDNIVKSYGKKDYRYQCGKEPLCNYCNTAQCRSRKYGVGSDGAMPGLKSLTKINTDPPLWGLICIALMVLAERATFETDELRKPDLFARKCMETVSNLPPLYKQNDWNNILNTMMENMTVIDVPKEMTPKGQLVEHLSDFLVNKTAVENSSSESLLRVPHKDDFFYYFRLKDLQAYLKSAQFTALKENHVTNVLIEELGAVKKQMKISTKCVNTIQIPAVLDDSRIEFTKKVVEDDEPF